MVSGVVYLTTRLVPDSRSLEVIRALALPEDGCCLRVAPSKVARAVSLLWRAAFTTSATHRFLV